MLPLSIVVDFNIIEKRLLDLGHILKYIMMNKLGFNLCCEGYESKIFSIPSSSSQFKLKETDISDESRHVIGGTILFY